MAENRPLDKLVRELVLAEGDARQPGPAAFFATCVTPKEAAARVARVALGVNLGCAECHAHPTTSFTRADFASLVDCFGGLRIDRAPREKDQLTIRWAGQQVIAKSDVRGSAAALFSAISRQADSCAALADWLAGEGQMPLARNLVNRYWRHFFGRGLVEPDADLRTSVEASMPELLDLLAKDLIEHDFDARHLVQTICGSRLYQLGHAGSRGATTQTPLPAPDPTEFSAAFQSRSMDSATLSAAIDQATETQGALFGDIFGTPAQQGEQGPLWHWHRLARPIYSVMGGLARGAGVPGRRAAADPL